MDQKAKYVSEEYLRIFITESKNEPNSAKAYENLRNLASMAKGFTPAQKLLVLVEDKKKNDSEGWNKIFAFIVHNPELAEDMLSQALESI